MNILFISREIYPYRKGGKEIFLHNLSKRLIALGHNVWFLSEYTHKEASHLNYLKISPFNFKGLKAVSFTTKALIKLKGIIPNIDIINSHNHDINNMTPFLLKMMFRKPYVITSHGGGLIEWKPSWLIKKFYKAADAVIVVSNAIKEEYLKRGVKNIRIIPPVPKVTEPVKNKAELRERYGFKEEDIIVIFVGRLSKAKRCDQLVYAFYLMGKKYLDEHSVKLVIIGNGPERKNIGALIDRFDLSKYIKIMGELGNETVLEYLKLADIFVLPSEYEGYPVSLIEAMSIGTAIVGSDVRGINTLINDTENGLLFREGDVQDLSVKLKTLIDNEKKRLEIARKAKEFAEREFSFDKIVNDYIEVFCEVINRYKKGRRNNGEINF